MLGVTRQPDKTIVDSVTAALEDKVRLLVFDNCEHLREATADIMEAILARSATVKMLATSREGLGLADEQLWPVPSLDVAAGSDSPAVKLFAERARSVSPRFSLTDAGAAAVEICRRLDGIPLAIELAASRMASMTPDEVRDRLDQRFRLLVGARRGLERHQTLRHAVAWSYDLLSGDEKVLLDRCSVFAGGFDLESACVVGGFDDEFAALDLLDALVRKSLLVADRSAGRTRFSMLETVRQFAEEQLVARGRPRTRGTRTPGTSPGANPTSSRCGTALGSARPMNGSTPKLRTCVSGFVGLPIRRISMPPQRSSSPRRSSDFSSRTARRSRGPRNSSNRRAPWIIRGSPSCWCWRRCAGPKGESKTHSATS